MNRILKNVGAMQKPLEGLDMNKTKFAFNRQNSSGNQFIAKSANYRKHFLRHHFTVDDLSIFSVKSEK